MKTTVTKVKKHSRTYLVPLVITLAAAVFWYYFGDRGHWWWPVLIGGILVVNVWVFVTNKNERG